MHKCEICQCDIDPQDYELVTCVSDEDEYPERYVCTGVCYETYMEYQED